MPHILMTFTSSSPRTWMKVLRTTCALLVGSILFGCANSPQRNEFLAYLSQQTERAKQGDVKAQAWLCKIYPDTGIAGWGQLQKDWCRAAALNGDRASMWTLAWAYRTDAGRPGSMGQSVYWFDMYYQKYGDPEALKYANKGRVFLAEEQQPSILGKVAVGAFTTGVVGMANASAADKAKVLSATYADLATDGKANATSSLLTSQTQKNNDEAVRRKQLAEQSAGIAQAKAMEAEAANNKRLLKAAAESRQPTGVQLPTAQNKTTIAQQSSFPGNSPNTLEQERQKTKAQLAEKQIEQDHRKSQALQQEEQKQALQQEQARKKDLALKTAEREAAKLAEQKAENQSREQYLKSVAAGTRLVATKCPDGEGKYYATGKRPNIKPEVVACVDVHFRAYCPGSAQFSAGVAHNFIGMSGCFGDTYDIIPKPACKVDAVRIEVVEARACNS